MPDTEPSAMTQDGSRREVVVHRVFPPAQIGFEGGLHPALLEAGHVGAGQRDGGVPDHHRAPTESFVDDDLYRDGLHSSLYVAELDDPFGRNVARHHPDGVGFSGMDGEEDAAPLRHSGDRMDESAMVGPALQPVSLPYRAEKRKHLVRRSENGLRVLEDDGAPPSRHDGISSTRRWLSSAVRSSPKIPFSSAILASDWSSKGTLPSKACSTMPSSKSPRVMSWRSATALSTFKRRFSILTPVCTLSTFCPMLSMYHGTVRFSRLAAAWTLCSCTERWLIQ